jgi:hypothetical protein
LDQWVTGERIEEKGEGEEEEFEPRIARMGTNGHEWGEEKKEEEGLSQRHKGTQRGEEERIFNHEYHLWHEWGKEEEEF